MHAPLHKCWRDVKDLRFKGSPYFWTASKTKSCTDPGNALPRLQPALLTPPRTPPIPPSYRLCKGFPDSHLPRVTCCSSCLSSALDQALGMCQLWSASISPWKDYLLLLYWAQTVPSLIRVLQVQHRVMLPFPKQICWLNGTEKNSESLLGLTFTGSMEILEARGVSFPQSPIWLAPVPSTGGFGLERHDFEFLHCFCFLTDPIVL